MNLECNQSQPELKAYWTINILMFNWTVDVSDSALWRTKSSTNKVWLFIQGANVCTCCILMSNPGNFFFSCQLLIILFACRQLLITYLIFIFVVTKAFFQFTQENHAEENYAESPGGGNSAHMFLRWLCLWIDLCGNCWLRWLSRKPRKLLITQRMEMICIRDQRNRNQRNHWWSCETLLS